VNTCATSNLACSYCSMQLYNIQHRGV
jgi:hypothetical protein